jgi:hypothetical protein
VFTADQPPDAGFAGDARAKLFDNQISAPIRTAIWTNNCPEAHQFEKFTRKQLEKITGCAGSGGRYFSKV